MATTANIFYGLIIAMVIMTLGSQSWFWQGLLFCWGFAVLISVAHIIVAVFALRVQEQK